MAKSGRFETIKGRFTNTLSLKGSSRACLCLALSLGAFACATGGLPEEKHAVYAFPEKSVFVEEPIGKDQGRPYKVLGWVRSKAEYPTMEQQNANDNRLCRNYYNKAARDLLKEAKKVNADAVIKVRSVVLTMDGRTEEHVTPECSDDGADGEILLRGIAIKFKSLNEKKPVLAPE